MRAHERGGTLDKEKKVSKSEKRKLIRKDLYDQLLNSGNIGNQYEDLIDDYMYLYSLKDKLQKDIKKNGIRVKLKNGNGIESEKDNASIGMLLKVNTQMLKIISDLGLKEPILPQSLKQGDKDDLLSRD